MIKKILYIFILLLSTLVIHAQDSKLTKLKKDVIEQIDTVTLLSHDYEEEVIDSLHLPWPFFIKERLDSTMQFSPYMKGVNAGVMVYDLTADSTLYTYHEKNLLKPASNMKLFSGITALNELGPDYPLSTKLYYTGEIRRDTVYFQPDSLRLGIPLEELVDSLGNPQYKFVNVLHGNIIGVGSYDPMFNGLELNEFSNKVVELKIDSINGDFLEDDHFRFSPSVNPLQVNRSNSFLTQLQSILAKRGIHSSGIVGKGICSADTILIAQYHNKLRQVMFRMMKQSDNQYAENVYQLVNSRKKPVHAVKNLIKELGFNPDTYTFGDGSGLSHDTRVSAELEVAFLRYARHQETIYPTLYETLPIAGLDGTLGSRMKEYPTYKNVRAKTGTINGVITLAGYCTAFNGHELAFAILLNSISSQVTAKALEDELCTIMTHDSSFIPKKKVIVVKHRPVRRRPVARKNKKRK